MGARDGVAEMICPGPSAQHLAVSFWLTGNDGSV